MLGFTPICKIWKKFGQVDIRKSKLTLITDDCLMNAGELPYDCQMTVCCLMITWWLPNDCLMTAWALMTFWWLSDDWLMTNCLMTPLWLSDDSLMTAYQLPYKEQMTASWLSYDCLTTASQTIWIFFVNVHWIHFFYKLHSHFQVWARTKCQSRIYGLVFCIFTPEVLMMQDLLSVLGRDLFYSTCLKARSIQ